MKKIAEETMVLQIRVPVALIDAAVAKSRTDRSKTVRSLLEMFVEADAPAVSVPRPENPPPKPKRTAASRPTDQASTTAKCLHPKPRWAAMASLWICDECGAVSKAKF